MDNCENRIKNLSTDQLKDFLKTVKNKKSSTKKMIKGIEREIDFYDVSFAQQRLWFLDQLVSDNPFYNMPMAVKITGNLDKDILETSLNKVIKRHEILRTVFSDIKGKPVQMILPELKIGLAYMDIRILPDDKKQAELENCLGEEALRPFNLKQGPLFRANLYRTDDYVYVLAVTMHHIISDGWSLGILIKEIALIYDSLSNNKKNNLDELPIQYVDFTLWQKEWLTGDIYDKQLNYWIEELKDAPQILELPTDFRRPSVPSFKGKRIYFDLEEKLTTKLKQIAQGEKATLFMVLLSAFNILLYKYTRQKDILIGTPIANRSRRELEGLIGYFANTLILRTKLDDDLTFAEIVEQVKNTTLGAYENQDLPFEKIVEELNLEREMSYTPLFQVSFVLQNTPEPDIGLNDIKIEPLKVESGTSKFDLWLSMVEINGCLQGTVEYSTDIFRKETIRYMITHLKEILNNVTENPNIKISQLSMITWEEENKIINIWNRNGRKYIKEKSLKDVFEENTKKFSDNIALVLEGTEITYDELNKRSNCLARYLNKKGIKRGDLVGVYLDRSIEMIVSILAILKNGSGYVPIDIDYPKERVGFILEDSNACILLTESGYSEKIDKNRLNIIYLDQIKGSLEEENDDDLDILVDPKDIAYIIYTSGSTGKPKGVKVKNENVVRLMTATEDLFHFNETDVWTLFHSYAFDFSVWEIWGAFFYGGKLVMVSYISSRSPEKFYELVLDNGVTVLNQTPSAFSQFIEADRIKNTDDLPLRYIIFGGEALDFQRLDPWFKHHGDKKPQLINMYGITETTVHVTYYPISMSDIEEDRESIIGVPIPDLKVYILDENRNISPICVPGEIYVGGNGISGGYLKRPWLTEEKFIKDPFSKDNNSLLYRTGDLARYLPDGNLEFFGRIDNQVKVRGFRIELGEIESALRKHEAVKDAVVMVREDVPGDKRLVAYILQDENYTGSDSVGNNNLIEGQIGKWEMIFDEYYSKTPSNEDGSFNIIGWNSSYDNRPLPEEEMREWLNNTINRIKSINPQKVLEIGYGTGMILFKIAPLSLEYWGSDISSEAKRYVEEQLKTLKIDSQVYLMERDADNFTNIKSDYFDTVIINSVIQYFPDIEYLVSVLEKSVETVKTGGSIFLGDLRNLSLQKAFYTSIELYKADPSLKLEQVKKNINKRIKYDSELVIDPYFFTVLKKQISKIGNIEILVKKGMHSNEMNCFRYDVIIHIGNEEKPDEKRLEWDWDNGKMNIKKIEELLDSESPEQLLIKYIKNKRVINDMLAANLIEENKLLKTVGELREYINKNDIYNEAMDPEQFWSLESKHDYDIDIYLSLKNEDSFHVLFTKKGSKMQKVGFVEETEDIEYNSFVKWNEYSGNPLQGLFNKKVIPELREYLLDKLPGYMHPSSYVLIDEIKMTTNGKVDKKALPKPDITTDIFENYTAPTTALEKLLADLYSSLLSIEKVDINTGFFELGGHSLLATQLIFKLRDILGINIPLRILFETPTIAGMAAAIEKIKSDKYENEVNITHEDLKQDTVLDNDIIQLKLDDKRINSANVLLTGATGFLGSYMLTELLRTTDDGIYCLVRGGDKAEGMERIKENMKSYGLWNDTYLQRIKPVIGNLSEKYLGLSRDDFYKLSKEIRTIYHNGALVNFIYPYSAIKDANVGGTREIVRLSLTNGIKPIHYISTLYIFVPKDKNGPYEFEEDDNLEKGGVPYMGYTQSKWAAEKLLSEARKMGCPVTNYRLGRIAGHSITGACQTKDFLWKIIKGSIQLGCFPDLDAPVDIVPVDYASSLIVGFSQDDDTENKNFHIFNPKPIEFKDLFGFVRDYGYHLRMISYQKWVEMIEKDGERNALYELLPLFSERSADGPILPVKYKAVINPETVSGCPLIDYDLIEKYLDYFVNSGFIDAPGVCEFIENR